MTVRKVTSWPKGEGSPCFRTFAQARSAAEHQRCMESRGPSFGITLVAVYVAGTISSSVWDLLGGALVLGDGYTLRNLIGSVALLALSASSGGASLGSAR